MTTAFSVVDAARRNTACGGKKKYKSIDRAWQVCMKLYRRYGDLQWAYECTHCPHGSQVEWCDKCPHFHTGHTRDQYQLGQLRMAALTW